MSAPPQPRAFGRATAAVAAAVAAAALGLLGPAPTARATGLFASAVTVAVGALPSSVAVQDLDGDGTADLVVANSGDAGSRAVSVLRGRGDGTFGSEATYAAGPGLQDVVLADLDGDGDADIAVTLFTGAVALLANDGNGAFSLASTVPVAANPQGVVAADFDGDGDIDLAIGHAKEVPGQISTTVSVLANNGDATFAPPSTFPSGTIPGALATTDVDGDGRPDLVVANRRAGTLAVLRNEGSGAFAAPVTYPVGAEPVAVEAADLDGDHRPDLVVANQGLPDGPPGSLSILRNTGGGTFSAAASVAAGPGPAALVISDLDADGTVDLAVANRPATTVSVLRGLGAAEFGPPSPFVAGPAPAAVTAADLDGDDLDDLVVAVQHPLPQAGQLALLFNNSSFVTIVSNANPALVGEEVVLTAGVALRAPPTGTVTFEDRSTELGTVPLPGAEASLAVRFASAGSHPITARFSGDDNHAPSTSAVLIQTVTAPVAATVAAVAEPSPPSTTELPRSSPAAPAAAGPPRSRVAATGADPGRLLAVAATLVIAGVGLVAGAARKWARPR